MSSENITLVFDDLEPIKIPVKIGNKDYVLKEADESAATKFKNHFLKCAVMQDGKVIGMDGIADADSLLVSLCLFEVVKNKDGAIIGEKGVPQGIIRSWKPRVVRTLYEKAKEISYLEDQQETVQSLEKRIAEDTIKLENLRKHNVNTFEEMHSKNLLTSTEDSIATVKS